MAGSWGHITNDDGTPYAGKYGMGDLLENGGDVNEACEEMYGMIWYLAFTVAEYQLDATINPSGISTRERMLRVIAEAQANYRGGVEMGQG